MRLKKREDRADATGAAVGLPQFGNPNVPKIFEVDVTNVQPDPNQPRRRFDDSELQELAGSLEKKQLHPILVRKLIDGDVDWQIVAGERRWRAAKLVGKSRLIAMQVSEEDNPEELALIENMHRSDLMPLEEAAGVKRLMEKHGYTQDEAGAAIGKSRSDVNRLLRLLSLHPMIQEECAALHTIVPKNTLLQIARLDDQDQQLRLWEQVKRGMSLAEAEAARMSAKRGQSARPAPALRFVRDVSGFSKKVDAVLALPSEQRQFAPDQLEKLQQLKLKLNELLPE